MTMMSMYIFEKILEISVRTIQLTFTYILPLLSSIRAIHHRDKDAYHQWVTYFLLIHLLHLLLSVVNFLIPSFLRLKLAASTSSPLLEFMVVLWLSLPRFKGALCVYGWIQRLLLDQCGLEEIVDGKVRQVKKELERRFYQALSDIGWGVLYQIGSLVTTLKQGGGGGSSEDDDNGEGDSNDDDGDNVKRNNSEENAADGDSGNNNSFSESIDYDSVQSESELLFRRRRYHDRKRANNPQHSVMESLSMSNTMSSSASISSNYTMETNANANDINYNDDDDGDDDENETINSYRNTQSCDGRSDDCIERETYIRDFTDMLSRSLYVFARANIDNPISRNSSQASVISTSDSTIDSTDNRTAKSKPTNSNVFRLRVFSYESQERSFLISSVDTNKFYGYHDDIWISLDDVEKVQESGVQGIQFVRSSLNNNATAINDASEEEEVSVSDAGSKSIVENVLAEIVLADEQDRDTLLHGISICIASWKDDAKTKLPEY